MKRDALYAYRLFLAVVEAGEPHDAGLIDAHGIAMEVLYHLLLDGTETLHFRRAVNKVVDVQGFTGADNHGRRQGKGIHLGLLFLECAAVHLEELGVNTGDICIVVAAEVDHEENTAILSIVLFEGFLDAHVFSAFAFQFCPVEHAVFPVLKDAKANGLRGIKEAVQYVRCRDFHISFPPFPSFVQGFPAAWLPRFRTPCRRKPHRPP